MAKPKRSDGPDSGPPKRRKTPRKRGLAASLSRTRRRAAARLTKREGRGNRADGKRSRRRGRGRWARPGEESGHKAIDDAKAGAGEASGREALDDEKAGARKPRAEKGSGRKWRRAEKADDPKSRRAEKGPGGKPRQAEKGRGRKSRAEKEQGAGKGPGRKSRRAEKADGPESRGGEKQGREAVGAEQARGGEGRSRAAKEEGRRPARKLGSLLGRATARLAAGVSALLAIGRRSVAGAAKLIGPALRRLRGAARSLGARLAAIVAGAARVLTPTRCLLAAAIGCAVLLALSQFADYRGVAVGSADYVGVETIAPPPEIERAETGSAHSYLMVPAAAIAIVVLLIAVRSRRWQLCRLAVLIGLAAVAVSIFIDRPEGLDEGVVARDFAGAEASLLGGFWAQLFAGVGLAATSALLAAELRRLGPGRNRDRKRTRRGSGRATAGRRKPKGRPEAEEASA